MSNSNSLFAIPASRDGEICAAQTRGMLQHGGVSEGLAFFTAIGIEQWLRSQIRNGVVEPISP
jgi:hypothetical protein